MRSKAKLCEPDGTGCLALFVHILFTFPYLIVSLCVMVEGWGTRERAVITDVQGEGEPRRWLITELLGTGCMGVGGAMC